LHLLPLIIPERFLGTIVSIYVVADTKHFSGRFARFAKQSGSRSGVFPGRVQDYSAGIVFPVICRSLPMILHYIYDPLCGWCYGAKPLVQAARQALPVIAHGGGMMTGANRQQVSPQLRDYVMPHDRRIAEYTGQPFGEAYFQGLLRDHTAVFDSAPPIAAVLAAEQIDGRGLDLLGRLQTAHYVEGRRIADKAVLLELAVAEGFPAAEFLEAFERADTAQHIRDSRQLLARVGGQGFPTFVLERDGHFTLLDISPWLGKPEAFVQWLRAAGAVSPIAAGTAVCGIDGCA
jgi:putative protein-disulfide isomerase